MLEPKIPSTEAELIARAFTGQARTESRRARIERGIRACYQAANLPWHDNIVWVASPLSGALVAATAARILESERRARGDGHAPRRGRWARFIDERASALGAWLAEQRRSKGPAFRWWAKRIGLLGLLACAGAILGAVIGARTGHMRSSAINLAATFVFLELVFRAVFWVDSPSRRRPPPQTASDRAMNRDLATLLRFYGHRAAGNARSGALTVRSAALDRAVELQVGAALLRFSPRVDKKFARDAESAVRRVLGAPALRSLFEVPPKIRLRSVREGQRLEHLGSFARPSGVHPETTVSTSDDGAACLDALWDAEWWWPHRDFVVACELPVELHVEPIAEHPLLVQLHRADGPAVRFRDDFAVYASHGEVVPAHVIALERPAAAILRMRPRRHARAAIERMGWAKFIREANLRLIRSVPDPGNPPHVLALYEAPSFDRGAYRLLLMTNGSPTRHGQRREFAEPVPANIYDPIVAAAWQFNCIPALYRALQRRT